MELMSQAVRIALGLVVVLVAGILLAPTQPTLFAARPDAPVAVVEPEVVAVAPAPPAAPQSPAEPAPPVPSSEVAPARPAPAPAEPPAETDVLPEVVAEEPAPAEDEVPVAEEAEPEAPSLADLTAEPPPLDFRLYREPQVAAATTLLANGDAIQLAGLEPLPPDAVCDNGSPCGRDAQRAADDYLNGRSVICSVPIGLVGRSITAACLVGEDDIGEWLVTNGWADAGPGSRYQEAAETARAEGRGIWAEGGPTIGD